ncbi:tail tubular protein B [Liberibacter phage P-PA19-1]|nr:tail tubular protein B [Liberibacter phage P-PA19-1]
MGKVTFTKRSFASGELSSRIHQSRNDLQIHSQGFAYSLNLVPLQSGALVHRPRTISYPNLSLPLGSRRLIPFYSTGDTHVLLVFGHKTLSFVKIEGGEHPNIAQDDITTPYSGSVAETLSYAISGNLMILAHPNHPPYQLEVTDKGFNFRIMKFSPPPWLGNGVVGGDSVDAKLRIIIPKNNKDEEGEYGVEAIGGDVFKASDKGRFLRLGFTPKAWRAETKYSEKSFIYMYGKIYQSTQGGTSGAKWFDNTKDAFISDGSINWKVVASAQSITSPRYGKQTTTTTAEPIPSYYVWGCITNVKNSKKVVIKLNPSFILHDEEPTRLWNLSAWGSKEGYPKTVTFYQNRLVFSGTESDASSLYLSEYRKYNYFSPDGEYGSPDYLKALSVAVTDDVLREIRWMTPMEHGLLVGCDSSLWLLCIDLDNGFNIVTRRISGSGVASCPALSVGDSILFVCGAGRKIKAVSGGIEQGFKFKDVTQFVDHLFTFQVKQMIYQEDPYSLIWIIDKSTPGAYKSYNLLGCRFTSEEETEFAWHAHKIGGDMAILSLATFPSIDRGETDFWMLAMRRTNDSYKVVLERLDCFHLSHNYLADGTDA